MEVSLFDILEAREARARQQQALLEEYGVALLCFTMNIAGPVKTTPLIQRGFYAGLALLDSRLPRQQLRFRQVRVLPTGCEAVFAVDLPARDLKQLCTDIEEQHPLGRLFDMDVIDTDGRKLERETQRGCIVCGKPGRICAASRAHSVEQLQAVTTQLLQRYFFPSDIADAAVQSLIDEVRTTPKPGLVDRRNNGSHKDMDLALFEASAQALRPFFQRCVEIGQETAALPPEETFPLLRHAGVKAEESMLRATGGVNTHKGAIYALGLLCGSIGRLWSADNLTTDVSAVLEEVGEMVHSSVQADLASATGKTAGEQLFLQYGIRGIRGEAADGFPSVRDVGLPRFRQALADGLSPNDAGTVALLHLITQAKDTNLYHRGGPEGAHWATCAAEKLLDDHPPYPDKELIEELDDAFMQRDLSPGGCADLLAVTYFLHRIALQNPA